MNSLEYVAHVFEDLLGKFRETFWMNEPSGMGRSQSHIQPPFRGFLTVNLSTGGLFMFLQVLRHVMEVKEVFQPGELARLPQFVDSTLQSCAHALYKEKRATVQVRVHPHAHAQEMLKTRNVPDSHPRCWCSAPRRWLASRHQKRRTASPTPTQCGGLRWWWFLFARTCQRTKSSR